MVDVASFSDAELRTKLMEFGFPVMPITGTTRKVMEKKLKILLENKNKINSDGRRSLARYSSEEESDADVKPAKKDKNKRVTMGAPTRAALRKKKENDENDADKAPKPRIVEEKHVMTRTSKTTTVESGFDTGSDSESEILEQKKSNEYKKYVSPISTSSPFVETRSYSPPDYGEDVINHTSVTRSFLNQSPSRYTSYTSTAGDYATERLNQIRSRISLGSPSYDRPLYSTSSVLKSVEKEGTPVETPFLSNFTKRLSELSTSGVKQDDYKNDIIKEHDTNGSGSIARRGFKSYKHNFPREYQPNKQVGVKNNWVSFAVIAIAFLFFVLLGIVYLGLRNGQTALDPIISDLKVTYCDRSPQSRPGINCLPYSDVRDAVSVFESIKSELVKRSVDHRCYDSNIKPYLTEDEIVSYINQKPNEILSVAKSLQDMEILTLSNPKWEISLHKVTDDVFNGQPIKTHDELYELRDRTIIALSVSEPTLPWTCTLYNKIATIIQTLLVLGVSFAGIYSLNIGYKYYKHYRQKERDELFYTVEKIIDLLQSNASEEGDNYLVINHVRDMILPIKNRARMERTWNKAVDFINKNESRVRTEVQVVQGEPYEVWRWLGSPNLNTSGSPRNKTWQGQAFETQVGSVNSLPCSPTPCLKIRGMVDDGDRNLHTIREAVLSKCAHDCRILHCAVDINSKCVYLKCADQNEAAIAYRSLHGWWYAGNLITVKYLRLERYMQRYPDSAVSGPPYLRALQPATDWTS